MKLCKTVFSICSMNFKKWVKDYRIWTIFILLFQMVLIYVDDIKIIAAYLQADVPIWIFPFMYSQFYTKLLFTLPLILLFCNAPFIDDNQIYVYMRAGRNKWLAGQLIYIILTSAVYYLFILIASLITTSIYGGFDFEWGKVLYTISGTNIAGQLNCQYTEVSRMILDYFSPMSATWFTFVVSWSNAVLIGLIIFTCNYLTDNKYLGVTLASILVVFSCFIINSGNPDLIKYSPTSWITLDNIDIGGKTTNTTFVYCMAFYWIAILIMIIMNFVLGRKKGADRR